MFFFVAFSSLKNDFTYDLTNDICFVSKYNGNSSKVTVKSSVFLDNKNYSVTGIGRLAFNHSKVTDVEIQDGITFIKEAAFSGCFYLKNISLPNSLSWIEPSAFSECKAMESITLPDNIFTLSAFTFYSCISLSNITFGKNIDTIEVSAFRKCTSLKSIHIPSTVKTIKSFAFYHCTNLEKVEIENLRAFTGTDIFYDCPKLKGYDTRFYFNGVSYDIFADKIAYTSFFNSSIEDIVVPEEIEKNGTKIKVVGIFLNIHSEAGIGTFKIPKTIEYIDSEFIRYVNKRRIEIDTENEHYKSINGMLISEGKQLLKYTSCNTAVETLTVPEGVEVIHENSFKYAEIDTLILCESLQTIRKFAFYQTKISKITFNDGLKCIEYAAFAEVMSLKSIHIPDSVEVIGFDAFGGCFDLEEVNLPKNLTAGDDSIFKKCRSLKTAVVASTFIPKFCFSGCSKLQTVSIKEGCKKIDVNAFFMCKKLTEVHLPSTIEVIEMYAFRGCTNLMAINIPDDIIKIGRDCFQGAKLPPSFSSQTINDVKYRQYNFCFSLESYKSEESIYSPPQMEFGKIISVEARAFSGNKNLKKVTLPNTVRYIGDYAFENCIELEEVILPGNLAILGSSAFIECNKLKSISLPGSLRSIGFQHLMSLESIEYCGLNDVDGFISLKENTKVVVPLEFQKETFAGAQIFKGTPVCAFSEKENEKDTITYGRISASTITMVIASIVVCIAITLICSFLLSFTRGGGTAQRLEDHSVEEDQEDEKKLEDPLAPIE